ncbi:hypothetical protein K8I28_05440 [bacterium]|nr:hypothetical protein [bacterium]
MFKFIIILLVVIIFAGLLGAAKDDNTEGPNWGGLFGIVILISFIIASFAGC